MEVNERKMVINNVYHQNAKTAIIEFFKLEYPALSKTDLDYLISYFYQLSNYEEEGVKIRPNIFHTILKMKLSMV